MTRWQGISAGVLALSVLSAVPHGGTLNAQSGEGDAAVLSRIAKINQRLARTG